MKENQILNSIILKIFWDKAENLILYFYEYIFIILTSK